MEVIKSAEEHVLTAIAALGEAVQENFRDPVLARLWAAEQIRRATDKAMNDLLVDARRNRFGVLGGVCTWEQIGAVLGISAQGARQRMLRRRDPIELDCEPPPVRPEC